MYWYLPWKSWTKKFQIFCITKFCIKTQRFSLHGHEAAMNVWKHPGKCNIRQIMTGEILMNGKKDRTEIERIFITLVICSKIAKCQTEPHLLWNILMANEYISLSELGSPPKSNKSHNLVLTDRY